MKILVCISRTPDTTAKISFVDGTSFNEEGVTFILNPYDEWYALVRALELKEQVGGTVTVVHVGTSASDAVIRKALAIGADDAVRIDTEAKSADFTAYQIAEYAKAESFDLILTGKETIDYNDGMVGSMVAAYLDMPFVSFASKMTFENDTFTIERDIEGGVEVIAVRAPLVISGAKGLAEQRIPNMKGIMMAKRKPLNVVPAQAYEAKSRVVHFELPPEKGAVHLVDVDQMDELVRLLAEEAKVI